MEITKQAKVVVLCGGISSEREISIRSGKNCFNALKRLGYKNSILFDVKSIEDLLKLKAQNIDVVFLITHGKYGEDGVFQGILDWLKIPYTGSSLIASAIAMDKWLTKEITKYNKILTPNAILLTNKDKNKINLKQAWEELSKKYKAVFLKPRDDGSSVNIFKVKSYKELEEKIHKINLNDSDFIIEEYIEGREITVSIIEVNNELKILPILELKPKNEFYDYEAKYTKGLTEFILPARLKEQTLETIKTDSTKIFNKVGCNSFGRIDYILDENDKAYLLEINSLPGMTDTSDLPAQAIHAGIKYDELVEIILKSAKLHK